MTAAELLRRGERADDIAVERALQAIRARKRADSAFPTLMICGAVWDMLLELFIYRSSELDADADLVTTSATPRDVEVLRRRGIIRAGDRPDTLTLSDEAFGKMQLVLST